MTSPTVEKALLDDMAAELRSLESAGEHHNWPVCPACNEDRRDDEQPHRDDCTLAALLARYEALTALPPAPEATR